MGTSRLDITTETALDHLLGDLRLYHDATQLRCFVLSSEGHGTTWGIYRQCLRELDSRRGTLAARRRDLAKAHLELEYARARARAWAWTAKGRFDRDTASVDVGMYAQAIDNLQFQISEVERELRLLVEVGKSCKDELGAINEERRAELDQNFWEVKFGREAELSLATTGKIEGGIMNLILQLPEASFLRVCARLGSVDVVQGLSAMRAGQTVVEDNGNGLARRPNAFARLRLETAHDGA